MLCKFTKILNSKENLLFWRIDPKQLFRSQCMIVLRIWCLEKNTMFQACNIQHACFIMVWVEVYNCRPVNKKYSRCVVNNARRRSKAFANTLVLLFSLFLIQFNNDFNFELQVHKMKTPDTKKIFFPTRGAFYKTTPLRCAIKRAP